MILYVTHRMEEVFELCDSATVFRDGRHVVTWESLTGVTPDQIVSAMVGRDIRDIFSYSSVRSATLFLKWIGWKGRD